MRKKQKSCRTKDKAYRPYDRRDIQMKKRKGQGKMNSLVWSVEQETRYLQFLRNNRTLFSNFEERKKNRVFVLMSEYLGKRRPDQCRSHHQKMELKYQSIDQIIDGINKNKLNIQEGTEQGLTFAQTFKSISNTATQIRENKKQMEEQEEVVKEMAYTRTDFQVSDKQLWDCVLENVWTDC